VNVPWPVMTESTKVEQELIDTLVRVGGYTHPLLNPTAEQRSQGAAAPLMGQGMLLLAGGLAEQSGALDDVIALVGFTDVRFHTMVRAGSSVHLVIYLSGTRTTSSGKRLSEYRWTVHDDETNLVLEATALMLRRPEDEAP